MEIARKLAVQWAVSFTCEKCKLFREELFVNSRKFAIANKHCAVVLCKNVENKLRWNEEEIVTILESFSEK